MNGEKSRTKRKGKIQPITAIELPSRPTNPRVEIIDDTHQKFNGLIYTKDESGHYLFAP